MCFFTHRMKNGIERITANLKDVLEILFFTNPRHGRMLCFQNNIRLDTFFLFRNLKNSYCINLKNLKPQIIFNYRFSCENNFYNFCFVRKWFCIYKRSKMFQKFRKKYLNNQENFNSFPIKFKMSNLSKVQKFINRKLSIKN